MIFIQRASCGKWNKKWRVFWKTKCPLPDPKSRAKNHMHKQTCTSMVFWGKIWTKSWEIFWKNVVFSSVKLTNFAAACLFSLEIFVQNFQYHRIENTNPWWPYTKKIKSKLGFLASNTIGQMTKNVWLFWFAVKLGGFLFRKGRSFFFPPFVWSFCSSW